MRSSRRLMLCLPGAAALAAFGPPQPAAAAPDRPHGILCTAAGPVQVPLGGKGQPPRRPDAPCGSACHAACQERRRQP